MTQTHEEGRRQRLVVALAAAATLALLAGRANISHAQLGSCLTIADDRERLACYDAVARTPAPAPAPAPVSVPAPRAADSGGRQAPAPIAPVAAATAWTSAPQPGTTALERRWELRPDLKRGIFNPQPYRPLIALLHGTTSVNDTPSSPTRTFAVNDIQLDRLETKLQFSLKAKAWENILRTPADLWFGYTQVSYWQAGNNRNSSPFRETNYQPEAVLIYPLQVGIGDLRLRYAGASFTHESNGRASTLSRSWNRVIGDVGLEYGPLSLNVRPWVRIEHDSGDKDDNPGIQNYIGRGELIAAYRMGRQVVTVTGRHTLRGGDRSRGSVRLDWAFPITGALDAHFQVFRGYGESLIDYNHRQTTFGLGLSFFD